ncbi:MAG: DNRLRE domain-containing protein [Bacteroidota bacterium]
MKSLRITFLSSILCFSSTYLNSQNIETLVLRPGSEDGYDAEIRTDISYPIWDNDDFIANAWTAGGNFFIQRSLIKFDLSLIPQGSIITQARLSLFCNTTSGHHQLHSGENSSYLLRITSDWDQHQVTWDSQPSTTLEDVIILPKSQSLTQDYLDIDVTTQIMYFIQHPELNFGFMIQLVEEDLYRSMIFGSSNHLDPAKRPLIEIDYYQCIAPDTSFSYSLDDDNKTVIFELNHDSSSIYWWNFGNNYYSDIPQPIFTFQEIGQYNVCLTVSNPCDTMTNCKNITVCDLTNCDYTYQLNGCLASFFPLVNLPDAEYLWDFGDGFFSYLHEPVHMYNASGQYQVCLTISNECNQVQYCDTLNIVFQGSGAYIKDSFISVFPNPGNGVFIIRKENHDIGLKSIIVTSNNGGVILCISRNSVELNNNIIEIDLSSQSNGVYSLHVETDEGIIRRELILLN